MKTLKKFCQENGIDFDRAFDLVLGEGGGILPQKIGMQGYFAEITDKSLICTNEVLNVKREILFASFQTAEFGIGNGLLWLQCTVERRPFVFCSARKNWKSPAAKLLLKKIGEHVKIQGMKEYDGYTGSKFLFYMFK
ncbi:MAG: hypothetical protein J6C26_09165 [Clostridia bacterium]|nr:hypothetical protein [Clostridia bacterium]MBQ4323013.1 hypothetical protein [Clostridia bacterium]